MEPQSDWEDVDLLTVSLAISRLDNEIATLEAFTRSQLGEVERETSTESLRLEIANVQRRIDALRNRRAQYREAP